MARLDRVGGMARIAVALALLVLPGACGFTPLYAGGGEGTVGQAMRQIQIAPIPDRIGQLVRDRLVLALGEPATAGYRLETVLQQQTEGFGIRGDNTVTRERLTLTATYRLVDLATGKVVLNDSARSDAGVDVVSADYANVVAEETAFERNAQAVADQIRNRLALHFSKRR